MLLDGLVLAHRVFNHSVNYRSVVVRGVATSVTDDDEKLRTGWPGHDDEYDDLTSIWVGVIPVAQVAGPPQPHPDVPGDVPVSPAAGAWSRAHAAIPE